VSTMSSSKGIRKREAKKLEKNVLAVEEQAAAFTIDSAEKTESADHDKAAAGASATTETKKEVAEEAREVVKVSNAPAAQKETEDDEHAREEKLAATDATMTEETQLDEAKDAKGNKEDDDEEEQVYPHVLYPGGGDFNKLRKKQKFLNSLIESCVDGYLAAGSHKRHFVKENILDKIPGGLFVHHKEKEHIYQPEEQEAFERVAQKIRDIKKYRMQAMKSKRGGGGVNKQKPARAAPRAGGTYAFDIFDTIVVLEKYVSRQALLSFYSNFAIADKRKRDPDLQAKEAIIQVLHSEIKILYQANHLQKQEIASLKEVAAAQEKECKELEAEIAALDQKEEDSKDSDEAVNVGSEKIKKDDEAEAAIPEETESV